MKIDEPHELRDLSTPAAAPLDEVHELELKLSKEQEQLLRNTVAFCSNCGKEMNKGGAKAIAKTGTCSQCRGSSKVVEVQANGSYKLVPRAERRTSRKARKNAKRRRR